MLTLVIGNKNSSSWSLRPWLVLRHLGLPFKEIKLLLDTPQFSAQLSRYSQAGRVPVLIDEDLHVWDSLAIAEYLNEQADGQGWPADPSRRAHARAISAEMHSGFAALRQNWPMKAVERLDVPATAATAGDIARIDALWKECRDKYAADGPWLFGQYSIADAMYAPVVLRFNTYRPTLSPASHAYIQQTLADPHLQEWLSDAAQEVIEA
ncbi:MAG TPA: glutathione S-transferase family protein [Steroidobacteraceae bacterium]|jgi:glutathione S-transferase